MSINILSNITDQEFQKLNKMLSSKDFQHYKKIITGNYKRDKTSGDYILKEGLTKEVITKIDFILKRIGYKEFSSIREIAEYFKRLLEEKKCIVLFAYNGTGKTRRSRDRLRSMKHSAKNNSGKSPHILSASKAQRR